MSQAPFEQAGSLRVGAVDFVSPDEIKVALDIEAPESVALNAGGPQPFPRVNGYLLIPVDEAFLVGQVEWLTVERSAFPKRRGMQDFGLVDLPYPLRRLRLNPLGTLRRRPRSNAYDFRRGADAFPSIGTAVLLPTDSQLRSIVESGERRRVKIGTSPLAGDAVVSIDPNRLFGRHLAVLGNTGSGKSCSVAGLIRWSLEQANQVRSTAGSEGPPNARFIVLDPNGEYSRAFSGDDVLKARIFKVDPGESEAALKVPLWFWNSAEWCSFTQASARTQRPLLRRALREVKTGRLGVMEPTKEERKLALRRYLSSRLIAIQRDLRSGAIQTDATPFGFRLRAVRIDLDAKSREYPSNKLGEVCAALDNALEVTYSSFLKDGKTVEFYRSFSEQLVIPIVTALREALQTLGGILHQDGPDEDMPLEFNGVDLADHLEMLAEQENVTQFLDFLVARIRSLLSDSKMKAVIADTDDMTLEAWLNDYIGSGNADGGCVSVIDLSLVPTEVVHVVTAVIARMAFEGSQRYLKLNGVALPTVLVMEEAHTFIKRYKEDVDNHDAASICCQVFERIAREGRKFGLGLVLSSQRPSELSPTVLSQCNTFLLHRISNDRDQELVQRLVPDNLRGLLRDLPSLPSQNAILLGWASELPLLVKMNDLPKSQQPRSDDPDFWGVWVGTDEQGHGTAAPVDWKRVADDWQGGIRSRHRKWGGCRVISNLKPYHAYNASGIPWTPALPAHWRTERAKWLFEKMSRPVRDGDEVVTCFRDGTVTLRRNRRLRGYTEATVEHGYQGIRKGDLVIHGMDAFAGAIGVSDSDGKGTPVYNVCQPRSGVDARYYAHAVRIMAQSQWILALAKGIRERSTDFRYETFGNQRVPLPPLAEQTAIVRFLGWANGRLDRAIQSKRKVIALLGEQKQAIIHHVATRGLNPSVPLKSSGIPWLGEFPAHWDLAPLRALFSEINDRGHEDEPMLSVTIKRGVLPQAELLQNGVARDSSNEDKSNYKFLLPGDVGYNKMRAWQGAFGVSRHRGIVSPAYIVMRPTVRADGDYYHFLFRTPAFSKVAESYSYGIASDMWSLRPEHFRLIVVPVPPKSEQSAIGVRLHGVSEDFNTAINALEQEILLLREYRTRLVADVVTGKLDVREAAARVPLDVPLDAAADTDLSEAPEMADEEAAE